MCAGMAARGESIAEYQKGTIEATSEEGYQLAGEDLDLWTNRCGDLQPGQTVKYRIEKDTIEIRDAKGRTYNCSIRRMKASSNSAASIYKTGEILGYMVRRDTVEKYTRMAKVYELRGSKRMYLLDYCGNFQAGKFVPGETVQYRAYMDSDRIFVRPEGTKEYSCELEGVRLIEAGKATMPSAGWW